MEIHSPVKGKSTVTHTAPGGGHLTPEEKKLFTAALAKADGSQRRLAKAIRRSPQTINDFQQDRRSMPELVRLKLERYLGAADASSTGEMFGVGPSSPQPWQVPEWRERHLKAALRKALDRIERKDRADRDQRRLRTLFAVLAYLSDWSDKDWQELYEERQLRRTK